MARQSTTETSPPPYIPYSTFRNFMASLKATAVPDVIDNSCMPTLSGSDRSQMKMAFRFVGFTDEQNRTQPILHAMLADLDTPNWSSALAALLADAYRPILGDFKLENATPAQLNDKFRDARDITGMTLKRAVRFYLMAAKDAGLTISPLIQRANGTGVPTPARRRAARPKKTVGARKDGGSPSGQENVHRQHHATPSTADRVLEKLPPFDPSWTPDLQAAWFTALGKVTELIEGKK